MVIQPLPKNDCKVNLTVADWKQHPIGNEPDSFWRGPGYFVINGGTSLTITTRIPAVERRWKMEVVSQVVV